MTRTALLAVLLAAPGCRGDDCGAGLEVRLLTPSGEAPVRVTGQATVSGRVFPLACESEPGSNFMIDCSSVRVPVAVPGGTVQLELSAGALGFSGEVTPSTRVLHEGCVEGEVTVALAPGR